MGSYFRRRRGERAGNGGGSGGTDGFDRDFTEVLADMEERLQDCPDLVQRRFKLVSGEEACLYHFDGLINQDLLQRDLLPLLLSAKGKELADPGAAFPVATIKPVSQLEDGLQDLVSGFALLAVEGWPHALAFELKGWEKRSVEEPLTERNVRAPHEGFIENLRINTALLRKRLRTPRLKFKELTLGQRSRTTVAIAYLEGVARPELLLRLEKRLREIDFDAIQASGYIEQLTKENVFSPFPQYQATERPDRAAANLLEGRILVFTDGTPVVLTVPVNFFQYFQAFDDYSTNWIVASFLRFSRILAIFMAIFLPSFYIAILTFHYEAVPWSLLTSVVQARSKVPFPPVVEAVIMEFIIELIREASIRLPSYIGPVIGIVGGLVIGQAVVAAGIVSNVMIIVVGVTAVASFVVPAYEMGLALRLIRFPVIILSSIFGIVGLLAGGAFLLAHLLSLESLGQPYFAPLAPLQLKNLKDTFIRAPHQVQGPRPQTARPVDPYRGKGRGDG
ncbi:MAG: spore germination protein [Patescibacteria group bacterium]